MKFEPANPVHIYYQPSFEKIFVGRLALKERKIFFEYAPNFVETGLNLGSMLNRVGVL